MIKNNINMDGFGTMELILVFIVLIFIGTSSWYIYHKEHKNTSASAPTSSSSNNQTSSTQPYWLINDGELKNVVNAGLSPTELNYFFNNSKTLLIITHQTGSIDKELTNASWVQPFTSLASIQTAFSSSCATTMPPPPAIQTPICIFPNTKYILYDNEGWSLTSKPEQQNAISYAAQVQTLVHQHGLKMIFTPATNLANVIGGTNDSDKYKEFVSLNIAGQAAKISDLLDIQAQQAEGTVPNEFVSFSSEVLSQAKLANPKIITLIGIGTQNCGTTCSSGSRTVTGANILNDYQSINPTKQGYSPAGYWFNIPGPGTKCVNCRVADPASAVSFFDSLYNLPNHY